MTSLKQQIEAVKRELYFRARAYPRFVASGKMTQEKADYEIFTMRDVLNTLEKLHAEKHPTLNLG